MGFYGKMRKKKRTLSHRISVRSMRDGREDSDGTPVA